MKDTDASAVLAQVSEPLHAICRDCFWTGQQPRPIRCPTCHSPRLIAHAELRQLTIAHLDCDAFYASVEKRDRPELQDKPVIVGGGTRGVVTTCCYIARTYGVRSAMPMFKALRLCPDAVVLKPDFVKYRAQSRRIMEMMQAITPLVQPLSLDEAWMDLSGTERLNGGSPAWQMVRLQSLIEAETGVTVSIGLAPNKALAKIASDLDKPKGFAVIGLMEAKQFLAPKSVTLLPGVGPAFAKTLERKASAESVISSEWGQKRSPNGMVPAAIGFQNWQKDEIRAQWTRTRFARA